MIEKQTYCRICPGICGLTVQVEDNKVVSVRGDHRNVATNGYTCVKGRQNPEFHHSPDRILRPQKRISTDNYTPINSSQALDEVAAALARIIERHGPGAVGLFSGTQAATNILLHTIVGPFMKALGSPSWFSTMTVDQSAKWVADMRIGRFASGRQSFHDAGVWLLCGNNPLVSASGVGAGIPHYNTAQNLRRAVERGLNLIVVDPCRTQTAELATLHLQVIPGEDPTLFAAILREILAQGWHDKAFCDRYVSGLDTMREALAPFTLDYAAARTGVPSRQIHQAAAMFARDTHHGMAGSGTGPDMSPRSNLAEHLIQCLNVICGRFAREGDSLQAPPVLRPRLPVHAEVIPPHRSWETGHRSRQGYGTMMGQMMSGILVDEILTEGKGQIRALLCAGANPANALPDQRKTVRALQSLELLVTSEPRWSETARLSDYVFAPKLAFERPDHTLRMEMYGLTNPYAQYTPAILEPPPSSDVVDDWYVYWALASRLGLQLEVAGESLDMKTPPTSDELLAIHVRNSDIPYDVVKSYPTGHIYDVEPVIVQPPRPHADGRLEPMPSDVAAELFEVYSEGTGTRWSMDGDFSHLMVVRRIKETVNTLGQNFEIVRRRTPTNPAFLHPDDLEQMGIEPGGRVQIASENEVIFAIAEVDPNLRRGVVAMTHGFGGLPDDEGDVSEIGVSTCRLVSTDRVIESINGMPRMSAIPVKLSKAG